MQARRHFRPFADISDVIVRRSDVVVRCVPFHQSSQCVEQQFWGAVGRSAGLCALTLGELQIQVQIGRC